MAAENKSEVAKDSKTVKSTDLVARDYTDGIVLKVKEKENFGLTFPKGYNYTNEVMAAMLILKDTVDMNKKPVLESCTRASIENTLLEMTTKGLSMQRKQCYPVAYGGKLQCQLSVYGNTCISRRYGLKEIDAICIYDGDTFDYHIENAKCVIDGHKQDFMSIDTDKIKGAYAIATMTDGTEHVEIMNMSMIKQAWKQGFGYKESGNGTHQKFTDQMAMKTVKNRLLKFINNTYGSQELNEYEEEPSFGEMLEESVAHDIYQNANSEDFEFESEIVEGDVVDADGTPIEETDGKAKPSFA